MIIMTRYHLTITIFNPFFQWKLDARWKINSVRFYDYDFFFWKILQGLSIAEIDKFKLNLFECYKHWLSWLRASQFVNGDVLDWYMIPSSDIPVPSDCLASCIPNRKVRDKYFEYDVLREKYYIKPSFINYLKK